MTEAHSLTTYIASKILAKRKVKVILVLLFCCSMLFLSYQFVNYSTITSYQSAEYQKTLIGNKDKSPFGFAARHRGSGGGSYQSLKDIALKFEVEKHQHNNQASAVPSKGDTGPLVVPNVKSNRFGKPIFSEHVLGVAPEGQKHYMRHSQKNKGFFSCLTSGKQITWDKVNDDFCDCPSDGSDEPATAACMNGRFFCSIVKPGFPEYVPSSFVNDGICDCVDGSDEHLRMNSISCKNRS